MTMLQAIRRYYAGYAQFSGRASRADFWLAALYVWLLQAVVHFVSTVLDVFLLGSPDLSLRDAAVLLVGITHALPSLALLARRLHDAGFSRALATIMDSNITTFIAAAVLFYIGTGPVRGFAVTLGIGIVTTVFTAFTVTRLIVAWWVRWKRPHAVPI